MTHDEVIVSEPADAQIFYFQAPIRTHSIPALHLFSCKASSNSLYLLDVMMRSKAPKYIKKTISESPDLCFSSAKKDIVVQARFTRCCQFCKLSLKEMLHNRGDAALRGDLKLRQSTSSRAQQLPVSLSIVGNSLTSLRRER